MSFQSYKLYVRGIDVLSKLLRMQLRVTGWDNVADQPTIFVPNHFTRLETILLPYVLYKRNGTVPHTLGMHGLFEGAGARLMQSVGVMSVKHPQRNHTIIRELITNTNDWIIFAEGGLIKNKKTVDGGRLHLSHPDYTGPPHTGAAMLAMKAERVRQRYLKAYADEDSSCQACYEKEYSLRPDQMVVQTPVVVQPVSITFHPMRASDTIVSRLAAKLSRGMNAKLLEEIAFESSMLLKRAEINIHFGKPFPADQYLNEPRGVVHRLMPRFAEHRHADAVMRKQARRFTRDVMRAVYTGLEVNFDHLLATALYAIERDTIEYKDLSAAMFLAAHTTADDPRVRVHHDLRNGINRVITTNEYPPLERALHLAQSQGIITRRGTTIHINRSKLTEATDFDSVRMTNTVQVLANELEPNQRVIRTIQQSVRLTSAELQQHVAQVLHDDNVVGYEGEYERWYHPENSKPVDHGQPFLLRSSQTNIGVLLVHGYLASPQQLRPLAEDLHNRGFSVYGVRLPSHGTAPGHLSEVKWNDWLDAVRQGYCLLQQSCDRVIVGGISLGGVLALVLAAEKNIEPTAVFAINPPLKLRDRRAVLVPTMLGWRRALSSVGLRHAAGRLIDSDTETPEMSYEEHPLQSIQQVRRAAAACRHRLDRITAPILLIQGDHDPIVTPSGTQRAMRAVRSDLRLLTILPFDRHNIICGEGKELVFQSLNRFMIRVTGECTKSAIPLPRRQWRHRLARAGFIRTLT